MISHPGSPRIPYDDASRPWTLYAESMDSADEGYRFVVPEEPRRRQDSDLEPRRDSDLEPRRDSDLPIITFSDYAEPKQRPVSLIRG